MTALEQFVRTAHPGLFFGLVFLAFCAGYFVLAALVWFSTRSGAAGGTVGRPEVLTLRIEIRRSLVSMIVFALYGTATVLMIRAGWLDVGWDFEFFAFLRDAALLVIWNEIHFYVCHRLLHTPRLLRRVHRRHHESVAPTPFAAFSFHPLEAVMLGSVMILAMPFHDFNVFALLFLPVWSLVWNVLGHAGVELFPGAGSRDLLGATRRHDLHHGRPSVNFGFVFCFMDDLGGTGAEKEAGRSRTRPV